MTGRLVVLASGSGTNLQALLDAIASGPLDAEVTRVIVNHQVRRLETGPAGRGFPRSADC